MGLGGHDDDVQASAKGAEWNVIREELRYDTRPEECQMMTVTRRNNKKRRTARVEKSTLCNSVAWNKKWPSRLICRPWAPGNDALK